MIEHPSGDQKIGRITCAVADDEPIARKGIVGYIEKIQFLDLKGACENALELNDLLRTQMLDLLFLDIEMPYISGIEFLKSLHAPPKIIFTTAYDKYAIQGFDLEVMDYLLKPISFERFLKAANKAHDYFQNQTVPHSNNDYFFVKADKKLEKIRLEEIIYAEALENYVAIHLADRKIITHMTLKALSETLPSQAFIQPHKSYLVAIEKIQAIEGNLLHVGKASIPISKYLKEEVMEKIVNRKMLRG